MTKNPGNKFKYHPNGKSINVLQMPTEWETTKKGKYNRLVAQSEANDYKAMDVDFVKAYFHDPELIEFLKSEEFDLGIGTPFMADSLLFKALGIPYIKLHREDVDATALQFKFGK